ncbi:MAG: polysulfide reductase NrfD [Caldilineaceae bacterium]|nr:polysulfide reductase NrfD [Caldilineaceae bacterium]
MLRVEPRDYSRLIAPLFRTGRGFWITIAILSVVVAVGVVMYVRQLIVGLEVTGLQRPGYWGLYMVNFIFLIGVSMAGTLVSASLYLLGANWRRPITRIAETVTVFGLLIAALQIVFDMGRPDRTWMLLQYGRLQSPLLWDMTSLSTYILVSMFALYTSILPDFGILRDNYPDDGPAWRRYLYTILALGWRGNREQWLRLEKTMKIVSILIIPIGVSLHTVTAWIFSTTVQPGWHSTILGPYFVVGAVFSGIALLFMLLVAMRRLYHLEHYIGAAQYRNLGVILIVMSIVWFYFTYTEHLVQVAGQGKDEFPVLASKLWGADAPAFWAMVILMIIAAWILIVPKIIPQRWEGLAFFQLRVPLTSSALAAVVLGLIAINRYDPAILFVDADAIFSPFTWEGILVTVFWLLAGLAVFTSLPWLKQHMVAGTVFASGCIVAGMWLERWNILVPTLSHPYLIEWTSYFPTLTEWILVLASFALFALLFLVFFQLFPPISIWEVSEGRVIERAESKVEIPMPQPSLPERERRRMPRMGRLMRES